MALRLTSLQNAGGKAPPQSEFEAYLYVIGYEQGPVKVGCSANVDYRLKTISAEEGVSLRIFHFCGVPGRYRLEAERYAQYLLRDHHYQREWFAVDVETACAAIVKAAEMDHRGIDRIPPPDVPSRKTNFTQHASCKVRIGAYEDVDRLRRPDESRADFYREAIDREIARRNAAESP